MPTARKSETEEGGAEMEYVMSIGKELGKYLEQWIAVVDSRIVAEGPDAKTVFEKAKRVEPHRIPLIMKVPAKKVMVL